MNPLTKRCSVDEYSICGDGEKSDGDYIDNSHNCLNENAVSTKEQKSL